MSPWRSGSVGGTGLSFPPGPGAPRSSTPIFGNFAQSLSTTGGSREPPPTISSWWPTMGIEVSLPGIMSREVRRNAGPSPAGTRPRNIQEAAARFEKQIPRGLEPARMSKIKGLSARPKSCPDTKRLAGEFLSTRLRKTARLPVPIRA